MKTINPYAITIGDLLLQPIIAPRTIVRVEPLYSTNEILYQGEARDLSTERYAYLSKRVCYSLVPSWDKGKPILIILV